MTNEIYLDAISKKLSILISLHYSLLKDKPSKQEQINMLSDFDLPNKEIALILGTSKNTVEVLKSRLKTQGRR